MNSFEKAQELIGNGKNVPKRTLFVAYLDLHMQKPTIHPDDHLRNDGYCPYQGWEVILCNQVVNSEITEDMHYPTTFLQLPKIIKELDTQLEAEYRKTNDDLDYQMWGNISDVTDWLDNMDTKDMHLATEALLKLYMHLANENDTLEEESEKPAGVLRTCHDVLLWIAQQSN